MRTPKIDNLSPTPLLLVLAVAVFVTVPLRTFQLLNCVDPNTGFWAAKDFTVPVLYAICIAIILIAFILTFFGAIMTKPDFCKGKNSLLGFVSLVFAGTIVFDVITRIMKLLELTSQYSVSTTKTFFGFMVSTGALSMIFEILFGICSVVYMIRFAVSSFRGDDSYKSHKVLALAPSIWAVSRLIYHFVDPVNFRNVSQLLLEMCTLCFAMIFFLSFARIASDINRDSSMWILWFSGISCALFAFIASMAPLILTITGKGNMMPASYPLRVSDIGIALFISCFLFTVTPLTNEIGERK